MYSTIKLEFKEKVALITLNTPEQMNVLSSAVLADLDKALTEIEAAEGISVIIIWGNEKLFGAGANIREIIQITSASQAYMLSRKFQRLFSRLEKLPQVTIAALAGYTLGGCLELALACDLRIASTNARLGLPEITIGVLPGAGGTQRLARIVGTSRAKEIILTGEPISAEEAYRLGIVNRVAEEGKLLEEAMRLANVLATRPPVALALIKNAIDTGIALDLEAGLEHEAKCFAVLFDTEDCKEGLRAFLEKRKAVFRGR